jgi:hypothetical protein
VTTLTLRLSVGDGDYLLWVATDYIFNADSESAWTIRDFWQLRDGECVKMTDRWADLPAWFELHPLEVAGQAVAEMKKKLEQGFDPSEPLDGPGVWRVNAGDRVVWVTVSGVNRGVREIFDFKNCALVLGENSKAGTGKPTFFGVPDPGERPPDVISIARAGFDAAVAQGMPRTISPEWLFGA